MEHEPEPMCGVVRESTNDLSEEARGLYDMYVTPQKVVFANVEGDEVIWDVESRTNYQYALREITLDCPDDSNQDIIHLAKVERSYLELHNPEQPFYISIMVTMAVESWTLDLTSEFLQVITYWPNVSGVALVHEITNFGLRPPFINTTVQDSMSLNGEMFYHVISNTDESIDHIRPEIFYNNQFGIVGYRFQNNSEVYSFVRFE